MSGLDVAFTWLGRVWACAFLLLIGAVVACAVSDWLRGRRDRKAVKRALANLAPPVPADPDYFEAEACWGLPVVEHER